MDTKYKDIKDEELVELFRYKFSYHTAEAKKYKTFLDMYNSAFIDTEVIPIDRSTETQVVTESNTLHKNESKKTFEDIILGFLNYGKPMTSKMLLDEYNNLGLKPITVKDFSSKLSIRAKAGKIKNAKFTEYSTDKRFWWGLSDWFDGYNFKDEYVTKIHNYMSSQK